MPRPCSTSPASASYRRAKSLSGLVCLAACLTTLAPGAQRLLAGETAGAAERERSVSADLSKLAVPVSDLQATVKVTKFDSAEAEKIGPDFKTTYSLRNLTLQYKQPDKIRLEGHSATRGGAVMILNGATRFYEVPRLKIHKSENLESQPGKRQSLLEFAGVLSPGTFQFMEGKLLRDEKYADRASAVYELRYVGDGKFSYYKVWIDRQTHVTLKREWYDVANKLRATFVYSDAQEIAPDIWLPTKVDIKNAEGGSAVTLQISDLKVNQGLGDDPFTVTP